MWWGEKNQLSNAIFMHIGIVSINRIWGGDVTFGSYTSNFPSYFCVCVLLSQIQLIHLIQFQMLYGQLQRPCNSVLVANKGFYTGVTRLVRQTCLL